MRVKGEKAKINALGWLFRLLLFLCLYFYFLPVLLFVPSLMALSLSLTVSNVCECVCEFHFDCVPHLGRCLWFVKIFKIHWPCAQLCTDAALHLTFVAVDGFCATSLCKSYFNKLALRQFSFTFSPLGTALPSLPSTLYLSLSVFVSLSLEPKNNVEKS